MPVDYSKLGKRIAKHRNKAGLSQEALASLLKMSSKHISNIETGNRAPSLDVLIEIANALHVSADDLLVDSLTNPTSTAGSEMHRILLDCNEVEEQILTRTAKELSSILYSLGI